MGDQRETLPGTGIHLAVKGGVAEITIARPEVGNTLDSRAFAGLAAALRSVEDEPGLYAAVLRSSVEGVFCSGGNYVDPEQPRRASPQYGENLGDCFDAWTSRSFPVIALVDGTARAFGAALALTSDFTFASPAASFGLPELSRGVVPSYAIALLRTRHSSRFVRELVFSTEPVAAVPAAQRGLITSVSNDLPNAQYAVLERLGSIGAAAVRAAHRTLNAIDAAPDLAAVRRIADAGVAEQLRSFDSGHADQSYLGLTTEPPLP